MVHVQKKSLLKIAIYISLICHYYYQYTILYLFIQVRSLGQEDPLEKGMATRSSIPAWRIP